MTRTPITPYTKVGGTKLPALQALRLQDPQAQRAIESLREWVEVRLGSRGDPYEKAVTLREFESRLESVFKLAARLSEFDGTINTLQAAPVESLPTKVRVGSFVLLNTGDLYFGATSSVWKKVTLT